MKRTPQSSITALLEGVEQAKQKKEFNILKDLKTLHAQYTRVNKRDYLALLDKLVEKYSTDEAAVIHAALLKKCQAGDMDAIRLWTELQKESGSGAVCLQPHLAEKGRVKHEAEGLAAEEVPAQLGGAGIRRRAGGGTEACTGAGGGKPAAAGIHQRRGARAAGKAAGNSDRKE